MNLLGFAFFLVDWGDEMLRQMVRERAQDRVGLAVAVHGSGEVFVEAGDSQLDGPDKVFRVALAPPGVLFLEGGKFLSPKALRKGGDEQLRRGFVQPGNA